MRCTFKAREPTRMNKIASERGYHFVFLYYFFPPSVCVCVRFHKSRVNIPPLPDSAMFKDPVSNCNRLHPDGELGKARFLTEPNPVAPVTLHVHMGFVFQKQNKT